MFKTIGLLTLVLFLSCKEEAELDRYSQECGCIGLENGYQYETLEKAEGIVLFDGEWFIRVHHSSGFFAEFLPCDFDNTYQIDSTKVIISGPYNDACGHRPQRVNVLLTSIEPL